MTETERADAELSARVAREAGLLLLDVRSSFGDVDPADRDRVKQLRDTGDREAHLLLLRRLSEERPDDVVLSEEGVDDVARMTAERVWIVDPLDGTWEFSQGRMDFAVHVALWHADGGRLSAGTVDLPAQGLTYSVLDEVPTYGEVPTDRPVGVVVSRSRGPADLDGILGRLSDELRALGLPGEVQALPVGSVGAKAAEIFAGRAEAYVHDTGFRDWDLAAPLVVARHRGLWVGAPDGSVLELNRRPPVQPGVVMAVPALAGAVQRALGLA